MLKRLDSRAFTKKLDARPDAPTEIGHFDYSQNDLKKECPVVAFEKAGGDTANNEQ